MSKKDEKVKLYNGEVLWFSDKLGYGFIECPELGFKPDGKPKSVFVHFARIGSNETFKTLSKGQKVTFEIVETQKGLMAVNVRENKIVKTEAKVLV